MVRGANLATSPADCGFQITQLPNYTIPQFDYGFKQN